MTNREYLESLSDYELASFLVYEIEEPDYDDDADGEWYQCGETTMYKDPLSGEIFWDRRNAVRSCENMLKQPKSIGAIICYER